MPSQVTTTPIAAAVAIARTGPLATRSAAAAGIGVLAVWLGILLAYDSYYWPPAGRGWPVSFFVVTLVVLGYLAADLRPQARSVALPENADTEQACSPV